MISRNPKQAPFLAKLLLKQMTVYNKKHSIIDDFEETFSEIEQTEGALKAKFWYWSNVLKSCPKYLGLIITMRSIMFKNYLKITVRQFTRSKLFSLINVFGLAMGITICMIISFWLQRELSYDRFHRILIGSIV